MRIENERYIHNNMIRLRKTGFILYKKLHRQKCINFQYNGTVVIITGNNSYLRTLSIKNISTDPINFDYETNDTNAKQIFIYTSLRNFVDITVTKVTGALRGRLRPTKEETCSAVGLRIPS